MLMKPWLLPQPSDMQLYKPGLGRWEAKLFLLGMSYAFSSVPRQPSQMFTE